MPVRIYTLLPFILCIAVLFASENCFAQDSIPQPAPKPAQPAIQGVTFQGKLYSTRKFNVKTIAGGVVNRLNIPIGQHVSKKETLASFELDRDDYNEYMNDVSTDPLYQIDTEIMSLDSDDKAARDQLQEIDALIDKDLATKQESSSLHTKLTLLQKKRKSLQRQKQDTKEEIYDNVKRIRRLLGKTVDYDTVPKEFNATAPFDGFIFDANRTLRPGMQVPKSTFIATIGVMDKLIIKANLFEADASRIKVGDEAYFTVQTFPNRKFKAEVSFLSQTPKAATINQPSYYEVELTAPNPDLVLREGYVAEVVVPK